MQAARIYSCRDWIRAGELADCHHAQSWPKNGEALVMVFSALPFERPIRPDRWIDYLDDLTVLHKCG